MADNEERLGRDWERKGVPQVTAGLTKEPTVEDEGGKSV